MDPLELSTAMTAWKTNRGLSYLRYTCPASMDTRDAWCLLMEGRGAPSCPLKLEFY